MKKSFRELQIDTLTERASAYEKAGWTWVRSEPFTEAYAGAAVILKKGKKLLRCEIIPNSTAAFTTTV